MTTYAKDEDGIIHINPFICPECGSKDETLRGYELFLQNVDDDNPWSNEFQYVNCTKCIRTIPGSLAYRYGKDCKTYDDAKRIWKEKFRNLIFEHLRKDTSPRTRTY